MGPTKANKDRAIALMEEAGKHFHIYPSLDLYLCIQIAEAIDEAERRGANTGA